MSRRVPMAEGDGSSNGGEGNETDADKAKAEKAKAEQAKADEAKLGDAGKAALTVERDARKDAEKDARAEAKGRRAAERRAKEAEAALSEIEGKGEDNQTDQEKALKDAARKAGRAATDETAAKFQHRMLATEILAVATGKLHTPADAVALLDLETFDVPDPDADEADMVVFREALVTAIDELITDKPYLRSGKVTGDGDGGTKKPVTETDDKLTPSQRLQRGYEANAKAG